MAGCPRVLFACALLAVVLCGCAANEDVVQNSTARAKLDQATGEILLPLSEYDLIDTARDLATFNGSLSLYIGPCMNSKGFEYSLTGIGSELERIVDDRNYGIWFEPNAREYGFGFPPSEVDEATARDVANGGKEWTDAELACSTRAEKDSQLQSFMPTNDEMNNSIVSTIRTDAYRMASAEPAWQAEREKWWKCLQAAGLDPLTGANDWGTKQDVGVEVGDDGITRYTEGSIRAAYIQARCNNETGLTQTLGDLEASYQAPLIDRNQAALNEWKTDKQRRLAAATDYATKNG